MKTRNGFVSNSSSSSFIVATKSKPMLSMNGKEIPVDAIVPDGQIVNKGMSRDQFLKYLNHEYCYIDEGDENFEQALFDDVSFAEKAVKYHDMGYNIMCYWIDYNDETGVKLIENMIKYGLVIKIDIS